MRTVCEYLHLNLARAKMLRPDQPLRDYRWSSWRDYLRSPMKRLGPEHYGEERQESQVEKAERVVAEEFAARLQMGSVAM